MPTIRELVEEAEENFGTGRHGNSAQLFKRAGLETLEKGIIDGLYLIYRSLYDMKQAEMGLESLQLMRATAFQLIRQIAIQSSSLLEEGHNKPVDLLELSNESLKILGEEEDREPVQIMLEQHLMNAYGDTKDLKLITRLLEMSLSPRPDLIKFLLIQTLVRASEKVHDAAFDGDLVAAAMIIQQICEISLITKQKHGLHLVEDQDLDHALSSLIPFEVDPKVNGTYDVQELILMREKKVSEFEKFNLTKILWTLYAYLKRIASSEFNENTSNNDILSLWSRYSS